MAKTQAMGVGIKTEAMGVGNITLAMGVGQSDLAYLCEDTVFHGQNDEYEIFVDKKIGEGGESIVHEAKRVSDGKKVVAKIHVGFSKMDSANRKLIVKFLKENSDFKKTNLMPLLDEGDISIADTNGKVDSYPIDIIPYVDTGEVKRFDYTTLRGKIIPELLNAMDHLHKAGFVHRDIKPSNIYMLDNVIILADFGTTGYLHGGSEMGVKTEARRGTPGYCAPELAHYAFLVETDFYSLGCTIATLYKGEHVYQTLLDERKLAEASRSMQRSGLPLNCPPSEESLQLLVDALTRLDDKERAGYDDVTLWLNSQSEFKTKWDVKKPPKDPLGFNFMDVIYDDEMTLSEAMAENWVDAKRYLYRGTIGNYFSQRNPAITDKAINILDDPKTAHNQDLGLARFLHLLNKPNTGPCPIYWMGKTYGSLTDIADSMSKNNADKDNITKMLDDGFLSWKLKNTRNVEPQAIDDVAEIEKIAHTHKYPELCYYVFMYTFNKTKDTADTIFKGLLDDKNGFHKAAEKLFKSDKVFALLCCQGFKENILTIKKNATGNFIKADSVCDLLLLYELFDAICTDKVKVREHFIKHGPYSAGYEFLQKLDINSITAPVCKDIAEKMLKIEINTKMSVVAIRKAFLEFLHGYIKQFEEAAEEERQRIAAEEAARRKRAQNAFAAAVKIRDKAQNPEDYRKAIAAFSNIDSNYQDINDQIKSNIIECEKKMEQMVAELKKTLAPIREKFDPKAKAEKQAKLQEQYKADKEKLDVENTKAKAENEEKCVQIKQKFDADHKSWQEECNRIYATYNAEYKKWESETAAIKLQSDKWKSQGLCPHCGGALKGLFSKKCANVNCRKSPSDAIALPYPPAQPSYPAEPIMPQMPVYTPRKLDESKYKLKEDSVSNQIITLAGIDWRVLAIDNNKLLLISERILENRAYHKYDSYITWEDCQLRKYLNGEFYNKLGAARAAIAETYNSNPKNPWYGTNGGNATTDKVFLLSLDEVVKYFGDSGDLANKRRKDGSGNLKSDGYYVGDQYNRARIAKLDNEANWWWLRSPGRLSSTAAGVNNGGGVDVDGYDVDYDRSGVRPALWLNL
ncbi:MAG: DUF6273 domain-containing protein [Oscillospiraceae bacterium]|nr:DUF6273 domain-containing protein [Oscillospiraceae bacterium]